MIDLIERLTNLRKEIDKIKEDARRDHAKARGRDIGSLEDNQRLREARLRAIMDELKDLGERGKA